MMVKNEEELLAGSLESVRNWVDEIIVIDTGSTDRTVEIAESYGAKVYHQAWVNDFSFHRNYSIEKATGDWILIIDADERIVAEDVPLLLEVINTGDCPVISVEVLNVYGKDESKVTFLNSNRIFRRDLNLKYEGIVHNRLVIPDGTRILRTRVRLKHLGYDLSEEKMKKKFDRSRALLEKQLEENPYNTFALFNYAQLLLGEGRKNWQEYAPRIIDAAGRAVELTGPENKKKRSTYLMCLHKIALANFYIGEYEKALEYCQIALKAKPDYLDPLMLMGHIYNHQQQSELSDKYYRK